MTFPETLCLDGAWQLLPIDTFRQGFYPLGDDAWLEQNLPAHWQQHPLLESYAGRMVYRKRFALASSEFSVLSSQLMQQDGQLKTENSAFKTRF